VNAISSPTTSHGTVRVFRQQFTLEDAIGSHHACLLEANTRVTNGIPLGNSLLLPVDTVICVQTLKGFHHSSSVMASATLLTEGFQISGTFRLWPWLGGRQLLYTSHELCHHADDVMVGVCANCYYSCCPLTMNSVTTLMTPWLGGRQLLCPNSALGFVGCDGGRGER
jgi:hypothetical protein